MTYLQCILGKYRWIDQTQWLWMLLYNCYYSEDYYNNTQ